MTMHDRAWRLIFAGGGTGGHLFPAIAIADRIRSMLESETGADILFVGTRRGIEYRLRESLGYPLELINVRGLARSLSVANMLVPFLLVGAAIRVSSIVNTFKPDLVVGTGGYVSLPVLKVANWKKITTVIQEQNSFPGISTRKLATRATRVYLGFSEAKKYLKRSSQMKVTGNPVRPWVVGGMRDEALKYFKLDPNKTTILVLGGSQGARSINNAILHSLKAGSLKEGYQLLWQAGKRDYKDVIADAGDMVSTHALFPFENRVDLVYAAADFAVARAGALTLAELEACAVPSLLIPYPHAAGDHQTKNARQLVESGFARVTEQKELLHVDLLARAVALCESGERDRMCEALMHAITGKKSAVDVIAEDVISILQQTRKRQEDAVES
jgi:UDP-N-acetylglucosamine--N-acetylmuramyl-(pentapeptide) pyrophosphoryl-undecaprenol N-acetylglucosamine transferase